MEYTHTKASRRMGIKRSFAKTLGSLSVPSLAQPQLLRSTPQQSPDYSLPPSLNSISPGTPVDYFYSYSFDEAIANQIEQLQSAAPAAPSIRSRASSIVGLAPRRIASSSTLSDFNGPSISSPLTGLGPNGMGPCGFGPGGMTPVSEHAPELLHRSRESASSGSEPYGAVTPIAEEQPEIELRKDKEVDEEAQRAKLLEQADEIAHQILHSVACGSDSWDI